MANITHWLEADELPKCQFCGATADERSFMCEHHAGEADEEVDTLREQLRGAVDLLREIGAMAGAKANGADARAMAKRARDWLDSHGGR